MQKKFNAQIRASLIPLSDYEQAQIKGGVSLSPACGCGDEKRKSVKVKKLPVVKSKLASGVDLTNSEETSTASVSISAITTV